MGVPALFRWLSKKYPKIISPVVEELPEQIENDDGTITTVPIDATKPNPNGYEYDNLYLDMNGIVHPCSHPEDKPAPANEEEMMIAVFEYTERVVNMVRPRNLLMIAVDGVAPRAKMNQQRSRRFRAAQDAADKDKALAEYREMLRASGRGDEIKDEEPKKTWDSNAITPGTPFMNILAECLRYWVSYKSTTDPAWKDMKIIISDATYPGEGEHKIMNFIRSQRSSPDHNPNTRHVIYGLDADLIMLGIATHEPHFHVLREDVFANDTKPGHCRICGQAGHMANQCRGDAPKKAEDAKPSLKPFIWLHVSILREYLAVEMHPSNQAFPFDLERALDDWVFMCFFVGNDFLPHLPSLDIREDGIDTLIAIWRDNTSIMDGYVTEDGVVNLGRAQLILEGLAKQEDAIFERRRQNDVRQAERERKRNEQNDRNRNKRAKFNSVQSGVDETVIQRGARGAIKKGDEIAPDINALPIFALGDAQTNNDPRYAATLTHADVVGGKTVTGQTESDNRSAAAALKARMQGKTTESNGNGTQPVLGKRTASMRDDESTDPSTPGRTTPNTGDAGSSGALGGTGEDLMPEDTVKLWEPGYQGRYYEQKFHVDPQNMEFRHKVARAYVEGLCWVLLYYLQGCPSWTWYYPYHYAPFGADFVEMEKQVVKFDKGKPFRPYEQLMGVMPARSNHTIPKAFHPLMTDPDSPIIEFYPEDFTVDLNGKKMSWQGIALLPFIDEKRLLDAMNTKYPLLTADEVKRNSFGQEVLIFSTKNEKLFEHVAQNFFGKKAIEDELKLKMKYTKGLNGTVTKDEEFVPNTSLDFPLQSTQRKYGSLDENGAVLVNYHMPKSETAHKSMLLAGVEFDKPALDYQDIQETRNRSQRSGRAFGGVKLAEHGGRSDGQRINYAGRDQNSHQHGYNQNSYDNHGSRGYDGRDNRGPPQYQQGYGNRGYEQPPPRGYPPSQRGGYQQSYNGYQQSYGGHDGYGGYGYDRGQQNGSRGYQGGQQDGHYSNDAYGSYNGGYGRGGHGNQGYGRGGQHGGYNGGGYNNNGYGNGYNGSGRRY